MFLRNLLLNENNELHNRNLHISGKINNKKTDIQNEKANIQNEKADIQNGKADIQNEKADIENIIKQKGSRFSTKTVVYIYVLFDKFNFDGIFGRSAVMDILDLKKTRVSELIFELLKSDIIESVLGKGKGKYKFKKC